MPVHKKKQLAVLLFSTLAFTTCFAVWVMFSIIGIPIKVMLNLSQTEFGLLVATPVLSGSLLRLPAGLLTDRFGGRPVFFWLMVCTIVPIFLVANADSYWQFLALGLYLGAAGASFSVGIAYVARWFDKEHQGTAMGVFAIGNAGAAVTTFVAPSLVVAYGWQVVPQVYAVAMAIMASLFWIFTYSDPGHTVAKHLPIKEQLAVLKDPRVWKYSQYYLLVFGGYMGLSLWLTTYYMSEYQHSIQTAALLAAVFVLPSGVIRALGGWLSDRFGAHKVTWWVMWTSLGCLFVMSYPQTDLVIATVGGSPFHLHLGVNEYVFTALLFTLGIAWGFGKASVFKHVSEEFPEDIGVISGMVGLVGSLGGFLLPIVFGAMLDATGVNSTVFMLLFGIALISAIWMHYPHARQKIGDASQDARENGLRMERDVATGYPTLAPPDREWK